MFEQTPTNKCGECTFMTADRQQQPFANGENGVRGLCRIVKRPTHANWTPQRLAESSSTSSLLAPDLMKLQRGLCFKPRGPWQEVLIQLQINK